MAALFVKAESSQKRAFEKTLYRLAIDAAEIPIEYVKRLKNMGFRTIGDYFGSPSRARQARIHPIYLYFDAIAGRHQTLTWFTPPPVFNQSIEFLRGLESIECSNFQSIVSPRRVTLANTARMRDKPSTMGNHIRESSRASLDITLNNPVNTASALADPTWLHIEQLQPQSPMTGIRLIIQQIHQTSPQNLTYLLRPKILIEHNY